MSPLEPVFRRYLTEEEQARLLRCVREVNTAAARRDLAWMRLLLATGMRIGEFSRLTVGDLRDAQRSGWIFIPREHRKGKRRDHQVAVTRAVSDAIAAVLGMHASGAADGTPAVSSRKGARPLSVRSYQDRMARWTARAGVAGASPHWLRHTRAQTIRKRSTARDPLAIVAGALGHASRASTAIYTAPTKEEVMADLEAIDGGARSAVRQDLRSRWEARHV